MQRHCGCIGGYEIHPSDGFVGRHPAVQKNYAARRIATTSVD
jgi:hypothetical protein